MVITIAREPGASFSDTLVFDNLSEEFVIHVKGNNLLILNKPFRVATSRDGSGTSITVHHSEELQAIRMRMPECFSKK